MASAVMATLSAGGSSHGTSSVLVGASSSPPSLTEQLDEVQLLEAMVGREGEFEWRQDEHGLVSGRLQVFLQLDQELVVRVARRERYACIKNSRNMWLMSNGNYLCVCAERPLLVKILHHTQTLTHLLQPPLPVPLPPRVRV